MRRLLKKVARGLLDRAGFAIVRKNEMKDMSSVLHHVRDLGFQPKTVIDVGVAYGTQDLYEAFSDSTHLLVEPLVEWEPVLKDICRKHNASYVLAAAGDSPGAVEINLHSFLSSSSICKESDGSLVDGTARQVPVVTIDDLCAEKQLQRPYLIKIDTQGYELKVLDGSKKVLEDTEFVVLEVALFEFFLGGPQFYDVVKYMKEHGFVAYDIFGGHNRPIDGALCQLDMAFVKENGQFRQHHNYATSEQRMAEVARGQYSP